MRLTFCRKVKLSLEMRLSTTAESPSVPFLCPTPESSVGRERRGLFRQGRHKARLKCILNVLIRNKDAMQDWGTYVASVLYGAFTWEGVPDLRLFVCVHVVDVSLV